MPLCSTWRESSCGHPQPPEAWPASLRSLAKTQPDPSVRLQEEEKKKQRKDRRKENKTSHVFLSSSPSLSRAHGATRISGAGCRKKSRERKKRAQSALYKAEIRPTTLEEKQEEEQDRSLQKKDTENEEESKREKKEREKDEEKKNKRRSERDAFAFCGVHTSACLYTTVMHAYPVWILGRTRHLL